MGKITKVTNAAQQWPETSICPNLYRLYEDMGVGGFLLLKSDRSHWYCSATDRTVDDGYAYNVCKCSRTPKCSAWTGKIYPCDALGERW